MHFCAQMFRSSKRFLTKTCIQDVMTVSRRYFKILPVKHPVCRYTCVASRKKNQLCTSHARFYTDSFNNTGDITDHSSSALEEQKCADSESEIPPGKRGQHVFDIDVLVSLLRQENAADICVIKVPNELNYTDYFVVVSGFSSRHLQAMAFYAIKVYKYLKQDTDPHVRIEGKDSEDWMCIDFGNIVVHFMLPETREAFELEKLWTLRSFDDQLCAIPPEILPEDFIYEAELPK
ncbi:hypothetical protein GJAV_G00016070 [Gymnothorax javanicus]|nr:hypothetical protein GJAV_G00016070 [Gymnothorax javanicus]